MTSSNSLPDVAILEQADTQTALVTRTNVPAGLEYAKYKPYLRYDFFCSCAYCTMTESEAQAIRFTIDHYHPRNARPELENEYSNLMYACDECNQRKGDRCPPPEAQTSGHRFFRPDQDLHHEHFEKAGNELESKTNIGYYTINAIDLNRLTLRRLRDIRSRLINCDKFIVEGIAALRRFHIDRLPPDIKLQAAKSIGNAVKMAESMAKGIDAVLRDYAKSHLIDSEQDQELDARTAERIVNLKKIEGLYPGAWRAPRRKNK